MTWFWPALVATLLIFDAIFPNSGKFAERKGLPLDVETLMEDPTADDAVANHADVRIPNLASWTLR